MGERVQGILLDEEDRGPLEIPRALGSDGGNIDTVEGRITFFKWATIVIFIMSLLTSIFTSDLVDGKLNTLWNKYDHASDWEAESLLDLLLGAPWRSEKEKIMGQIEDLEGTGSALNVLSVMMVLLGLSHILFIRARSRKLSYLTTATSILVVLLLFGYIVANMALSSVDDVPMGDVIAGLSIIFVLLLASVFTMIVNMFFMEKLKKMESGQFHVVTNGELFDL